MTQVSADEATNEARVHHRRSSPARRATFTLPSTTPTRLMPRTPPYRTLGFPRHASRLHHVLVGYPMSMSATDQQTRNIDRFVQRCCDTSIVGHTTPFSGRWLILVFATPIRRDDGGCAFGLTCPMLIINNRCEKINATAYCFGPTSIVQGG